MTELLIWQSFKNYMIIFQDLAMDLEFVDCIVGIQLFLTVLCKICKYNMTRVFSHMIRKRRYNANDEIINMFHTR